MTHEKLAYGWAAMSAEDQGGEEDAQLLSTPALIVLAADLIGLSLVLGMSGGRDDDEFADYCQQHSFAANLTRRAELKAALDAYLVLVEALLKGGEAVEVGDVVDARARATGEGAVCWEKFRGDIEAMASLVDSDLRDDVLRIVSGEKELQVLISRLGGSRKMASQCSCWPMLLLYVDALSSPVVRDEAADETLYRCREGVIDFEPALDEAMDELVIGMQLTFASAGGQRLCLIRRVLNPVFSGLEDMEDSGRFDEEGNLLVFNEQAVVAEGVRAAIDAWHENKAVERPDEVVTSKVHVLSALVRAIARTPAQQKALLARPMSQLMAQKVKLPTGQRVKSLSLVAAEWAWPVAYEFAQEQCEFWQRKDGEVLPRITRQIVAGFVKELGSVVAHVPIDSALRKPRRGEGFYGRQWPAADLSTEQRSLTYPFEGYAALFWAEKGSKSVIGGVVPCYASLTVWNDRWAQVGSVSGFWLEGAAIADGANFTADEFCSFAHLLGLDSGHLAEGLCRQFGSRAPARPVAFVSSVERHARKTRRGFGSALLCEFVRQVREMQPALVYVGLHVEPAQFVHHAWEDAIAPFHAARFEAMERLKRWCWSSAEPALKVHDVEKVFAVQATEAEDAEFAVPAKLGELLAQRA